LVRHEDERPVVSSAPSTSIYQTASLGPPCPTRTKRCSMSRRRSGVGGAFVAAGVRGVSGGVRPTSTVEGRRKNQRRRAGRVLRDDAIDAGRSPCRALRRPRRGPGCAPLADSPRARDEVLEPGRVSRRRRRSACQLGLPVDAGPSVYTATTEAPSVATSRISSATGLAARGWVRARALPGLGPFLAVETVDERARRKRASCPEPVRRLREDVAALRARRDHEPLDGEGDGDARSAEARRRPVSDTEIGEGLLGHVKCSSAGGRWPPAMRFRDR